jgi:hypothetical protein
MDPTLGHFGDKRLQECGAFLLDRLVTVGQAGVRVRPLGGNRAGEVRIGRFLRNDDVTPDEMVRTARAHTAALFLIGAGGDMTTARDAASQMLCAYHPETTDELRLAANIIGFSFQALEALAQAATPDLPLTRIGRLRGSAVSLYRESAKAERRLGQLQKARQQPIQAQQAEIQPEPAQPARRIENAVALIQGTANIAEAAKTGNLTWTQVYEGRQRQTRIAARLQKAAARIAALVGVPISDQHSRIMAQATA